VLIFASGSDRQAGDEDSVGKRHSRPVRATDNLYLRAAAIGEALVEGGFRIIEVPLNAPEPLRGIETMARTFGPEVLVGAGTVLDPADVDRVRDAGGRLIVMPHGDAAVIKRAVAAGLACTPGVATPTEAFAALKCGAAALKMFPAENLPPVVVKAWRAVLPKDTLLLPVGVINPDTMDDYVAAGPTASASARRCSPRARRRRRCARTPAASPSHGS
jgi:2-dehydro-3-deoxyphosphogalactonate aldolase